jgi:hypothetical protein
MISKSKLGAIGFAAAMGMALSIAGVGLMSPAFAIDQNSPALTGGGSLGHNRLQQTFRLKHHPGKQQAEHHPAREEGAK